MLVTSRDSTEKMSFLLRNVHFGSKHLFLLPIGKILSIDFTSQTSIRYNSVFSWISHPNQVVQIENKARASIPCKFSSFLKMASCQMVSSRSLKSQFRDFLPKLSTMANSADIIPVQDKEESNVASNNAPKRRKSSGSTEAANRRRRLTPFSSSAGSSEESNSNDESSKNSGHSSSTSSRSESNHRRHDNSANSSENVQSKVELSRDMQRYLHDKFTS